MRNGANMNFFFKIGCLAAALTALQAAPAFAATAADQVKAKWAEAEELAKKSYTANTNMDVVKLIEQAADLARGSGDARLIAESLERLGKGYSDKAVQPTKGAAVQEKALAAYRALKDDDGRFRLLRLLSGGYGRMEQWDKAIAYDEEALSLKVAALTPKEALELQDHLAGAYSKKDQPRKAIAAYEESVKLQIAAGAAQDARWTKGKIAAEHAKLGDFRTATALFTEAGDAAALGKIQEDLGDYGKAMLYYAKLEPVDGLVRTARVYRQLGEYKKALDAYYALSRASQVDGQKAAKEAIKDPGLLRDVGLVYADLGDYVQTIRYYEMAAKAASGSWNGKATAQAYSDLGGIYLDIGDLAKALSYHERALKAARIMEVPTRETELSRGDVLLAKGDFAAAKAEFVRLDDPLRLGRLHLARKEYALAVPVFQRALNTGERTRHARMLFAANVGLGHALTGLADLPKAAGHYRAALELSEGQREALSPAEKQAFFSAKIMGFDRTEPYEGLMRCLAGQGDADGAFLWSENLKARLLAEAIARGKAGAGFALPPELAARQEALEVRIRGLRAEMDALFRNGDRPGLAARETELKAARGELEQFVSELRRSNPEYASTRFPAPLKPADIALQPGESLLTFEVTKDKSFLFVLEGVSRKASVREIPLGRAELSALALNYRDGFEGISSAADLAGYKASAGKKLYDALFGSVLAGVPETQSLIIVPDEALALLPFESLAVALPKVEKIGESGHGPFPLGVAYLGDRFPVSYAQSATSLTLLRSLAKADAPAAGALAVVDPVFSPRDSRVAGTAEPKGSAESLQLMGAVRAWGRMGVAGTKRRAAKPGAAAEEPDLFPRLEKTHQIGESFKALFGAEATVLEGSDVTKARLGALPFGQYKYVAFGTHGILDGDIPYIREPALVLSQVGATGERDGFLTMSEVMDLKIPAEVVALTACRTGVGRNLSGEGVLGMGRAFQYAGARSVLMSMWSVEESATVSLTNAFFGHLKSGKTSGQALRLARADIRREGYEHPFYWSAFVLVSR